MIVLCKLTAIDRQRQVIFLTRVQEIIVQQGMTVMASFGGHPQPYLVVLSVKLKMLGPIMGILFDCFGDIFKYRVLLKEGSTSSKEVVDLRIEFL